MMYKLCLVLFVALTGHQCAHGYPLGPKEETYPYDASIFSKWGLQSGLYAAVPALGLVFTAIWLLLGCTWCYRHKECKSNQGADNQLFVAGASQLQRRSNNPPDSGFSEPANNNIREDNNNGPISLREMQNIANNNAAVYIVSENEDRNNRTSRESVVEFEPLPAGLGVVDPLEHCADWFGDDDFPRSNLQYLREIGRGWFGRIVEGEIEDENGTTMVAVKILNQTATLEDKARFLDESKMYRDLRHENILQFLAKCVQEDPWILIFELCPMDLNQYITCNKPKMATLNEDGVPLRLMCDITSGLSHLHARGYVYGELCSGSVLVRMRGENQGDARAVLGRYAPLTSDAYASPELYTTSNDVWSLGTLVWEICTWGNVPESHIPPLPDLPCPYRDHLYQVMQLCWNSSPARPTSSQIHALVHHLYVTHLNSKESARDDGYGSSDFEQRWQKLKPNTIPIIDEHIAIIHAPCTSVSSRFTGSDQEFDNVQKIQDSLSIDMDTAVSRSSSIMSDRDPLSVQMKSESLTNLHGSLEDVRNIYLTHNETAVIECTQANIGLEDAKEKDHDISDSSLDPWLKDIMAGSQDDVSYYKDVSDVMKNLDSILNSEKTSSSESSHQASPSRDNLNIDSKKNQVVQSCMVKSPGISNFQNVLYTEFTTRSQENISSEEDDIDRETVDTLSHSFERHVDTVSQRTLELSPDQGPQNEEVGFKNITLVDTDDPDLSNESKSNVSIMPVRELPKEKIEDSKSNIPKLKELCLTSISRVSKTNNMCERDVVLNAKKDCEKSCDNYLTEISSTDSQKNLTKSINNAPLSEVPESLVELDVNELEVNNFYKVGEYVTTTPLSLLKDINDLETYSNVTAEPACTNDNNIDLVLVPRYEIIDSSTNNELLLHLDSKVENHGKKNNCKKVDEAVEMETNVYKSNIQINEKIQLVKTSSSANDMKKSYLNDFDSPYDTEYENTLVNNVNSTVECNTVSNTTSNIIDKEETLQIDTCIKIDSDSTLLNIPDNKSLLETFVEDFIIIERNHSDACNVINNPIKLLTLPHSDMQGDIKRSQLELITELDNMSDVIVDNENLPSDDKIQVSGSSTVYMTLADESTSQFPNNSSIYSFDNFVGNSLDITNSLDIESLIKNDSTVYLDLPNIIKETFDFLQSERKAYNNGNFEDVISASTPKGSDMSSNTTLDSTTKNNDNEITQSADVPVSVIQTFTKPSESLSPVESPTKSFHTDTFDENSSVVLGPFENNSHNLFKCVKSSTDELLAFSSNFSEIDLETPSPLRDGNFLNEVPDIVHDDVEFHSIENINEVKSSDKTKHITGMSDEMDGQSINEKNVSPSTPPNSPGNFLASFSHQKYVVEVKSHDDSIVVNVSNERNHSPHDCLQNEIDITHIDLQITSKLAMAENENNMNIEYSGPLSEDGSFNDNTIIIYDNENKPDSYLAGNVYLEDDRETIYLDEESVNALRNELELKLPLAQVASIEPSFDNDNWSTELPPPPELIVSYPGALSPIMEETGQQLNAYDNDLNWNPSIRTDSSESYPEPCNNSTDEVTDLPTAIQSDPQDNSTYSVHSKERSFDVTFTVPKDGFDSKDSSNNLNMGLDMNNSSEYQNSENIDTHTYNKLDEEKENCERISQVSPLLLSPTTESSAPDTSDNNDNVTGVSTLSKTTQPEPICTKVSDTQCLSKATSIDSWCSNDTLYNVEENFDDLAMDPDLPFDFEKNKHDENNSESSHTLTHNDEDKETSRCSTYIVHDSESEAGEIHSKESNSINDNHTYTRIKSEVALSGLTKSDTNESTKSTQTNDLAYGTLISGLPSYSNCVTELISNGDNVWKFTQPELVRKSPKGVNAEFSPKKLTKELQNTKYSSLQLSNQPQMKNLHTIDISFVINNSSGSDDKEESHVSNDRVPNIPTNYFNSMSPSVTSTPIIGNSDNDVNVDAIPLELSESKLSTSEFEIHSISNFKTFMYSAELRPQDISRDASSGYVNPKHNGSLLKEVNKSITSLNKTCIETGAQPSTYTSSNSSSKLPLELMKSNESVENRSNLEGYHKFEKSIEKRPQDKSDLLSNNIHATLADIPGIFHLTENSGTPTPSDFEKQNNDSIINKFNRIEENNDVSIAYDPCNLIDEEETEQPHSIIVTESPKDVENINKSYDSHVGVYNISMNNSYDSHNSRSRAAKDICIDVTNFLQGNEPVQEVEYLVQDTSTKSQTNMGVCSLSNEVDPDKTHSYTIDPYDCENGLVKDIKRLDHDINQKVGNSENFAVVNMLNDDFQELLESNVDDSEIRDTTSNSVPPASGDSSAVIDDTKSKINEIALKCHQSNSVSEGTDSNAITALTESFLRNEKKFCHLHFYLPILSDIRFTGPASEIMSTSFTEGSPTEPHAHESPNRLQRTAADILKDWDSDSDSRSSNSSSGEFIWKQREREAGGKGESGGASSGETGRTAGWGRSVGSGGSADSGSGSGSGSEGEEVEFVPSSWDCRAEPSKSSLRTLPTIDNTTPESKKRVVFKRQKYHCVYEYPREVNDYETASPNYVPDYSTYTEWDPTSAEDIDLGYGQLFGSPSPLDLYQLRSGVAFDYDEDFFISSSARPFESLSLMTTTSQFFPGMHLKPSLLDGDIPEQVSEEFPPPPSPLTTINVIHTQTPSLDFTTPDSGVEDITPVSTTTDEDYKVKKLPDSEPWKPVDSGSSSESVSPSSPGGETLGGLRHTRDKLKLDLPPSPHLPSPRHNRVFNFTLDKPKRRNVADDNPTVGTTPLVMTDETPIVTTALPLPKDCEELPIPEPTFSTFGKCVAKVEPEQKIILTDELQENEPKEETSDLNEVKVVETVKGEGTVLDSGDEDSGIESSSKATLERNKSSNVS